MSEKPASAFAANPANSVLPVPLPAARYKQMAQKSPFAPATPAAPAATATGFFADFHLTGLGKIGDKDFVTIQSRDGQTRYTVSTGEPTDGIDLARVDWSDEVGKSKVTLRKGGETGTLEFDQALLQQQRNATAGSPQAMNQMPGKPFPGGMPQMPQVPQSPQFGQINPTPQFPQSPQNAIGRNTILQGAPNVNFAYPTPPNSQELSAMPGQITSPDAAANRPNTARRRVRIINSAPSTATTTAP